MQLAFPARWFPLALGLGAALAAVSAMAFTASARSQASAGGTACGQEATVVGVRGSGDPQSGDVATDRYGDQVHGMGKPGAAFAVALANRLPRGAVIFDPVVYPAVGLLGNWRKIINGAGAGLRIGFLGSYDGSVKDGKAALRQVINTEARVCPRVKLVLVGYSQGAQVVADVYQRDLTATERSRIAGVVVFGDPYFNPGDSKPDVGSFDPSRYGALGKRGLYPSSGTPIFSVCHLYDPICQGPGRDRFSQHTNYQTDSWINVAAAKIAAALTKPTTTKSTYPEINLTQVARGDFSSLEGKWAETAYAYNPQNGTGLQWEQWVSESLSRVFPRKATLTIHPRKLVFGPAGYTVVVTHDALTYSVGNRPQTLPLRWKMGVNVLTASLVNPDTVAINWTVYFYPRFPAAPTSACLVCPNNGVKIASRSTIVLWTSNNDFTLVFQR